MHIVQHSPNHSSGLNLMIHNHTRCVLGIQHPQIRRAGELRLHLRRRSPRRKVTQFCVFFGSSSSNVNTDINDDDDDDDVDPSHTNNKSFSDVQPRQHGRARRRRQPLPHAVAGGQPHLPRRGPRRVPHQADRRHGGRGSRAQGVELSQVRGRGLREKNTCSAGCGAVTQMRDRPFSEECFPSFLGGARSRQRQNTKGYKGEKMGREEKKAIAS